jgi:hypothetical protein
MKRVRSATPAEEQSPTHRRSFIEVFEEWRARYGAAAGNEPLELPHRSPPRRVVVDWIK